MRRTLTDFETYINYHEIPYESIQDISVGSFNIYATTYINNNTVNISHLLNMGNNINIPKLMDIITAIPEMSCQLTHYEEEGIAEISIYTEHIYKILPKIIDYKFTACSELGITDIRMYII